MIQRIKGLKMICVLLGIFVLASFLRFYSIQSVPPSPSLDEASIGYNAYSILKTGKDEYGYSFPVLLRAYDDWRPALYVYTVIPFLFIFGLSVIAVRLPAVLFSIISVTLTFFLIKQILFNIKSYTNLQKDIIALFSALLLAISPWHIYISRLGHEVNLGLSFLILGLTSFLYAVNKKKVYFLYFSTIFFALSFYTYQSEKIIIPFLGIVLVLLFFRELLHFKKHLVYTTLLGLIILVPVILATLSPQAWMRFQGTNAFTNNSLYFESAQALLKSKQNRDVFGILFHNRRVTTARIFFSNYLSHFNTKWLFFNSGKEKHKVPNLGLFYIWEAPFLLLGLWEIRKKENIRAFIILASLILTSPIPAAIATEAPHAMRSFTIVPAPQILVALGIVFTIRLINQMHIKKAFYFILSILIVMSVWQLYKNYYFVFPKEQSSSFQYALSKAVEYADKNKHNYRKVVFSNKEQLYQSYMFFLFGTKYDPFMYQQKGGTKSGGYEQSHKFDKYEFRSIKWEKEEEKNTLFIGNLDEFPQSTDYIMLFSNLDRYNVIGAAVK